MLLSITSSSCCRYEDGPSLNRQETDDVAELKTIYAFEEKYIQGDTYAKYLRLVNSMKPITHHIS